MNKLTPSQQAILDLLEQHSGQIVTREELEEVCISGRKTGKRQTFYMSNIVDAHMMGLRKNSMAQIETIRGKGYRLVV